MTEPSAEKDVEVIYKRGARLWTATCLEPGCRWNERAAIKAEVQQMADEHQREECVIPPGEGD